MPQTLYCSSSITRDNYIDMHMIMCLLYIPFPVSCFFSAFTGAFCPRRPRAESSLQNPMILFIQQLASLLACFTMTGKYPSSPPSVAHIYLRYPECNTVCAQ